MGHDDRSVELEVNMKDSDLMKMAAGKLNPDQVSQHLLSRAGFSLNNVSQKYVRTNVQV